jgi:Flp pilus assembly CpaF family ATPase
MVFEFGLKNKVEMPEKNKKTNLHSKLSLGYDCLYSKKILENFSNEIIFETKDYIIFDKENPKIYFNDIVKLSLGEKQFYSDFFNYIKEIPFNNNEDELQKYFIDYLNSKKTILDNDQKKYLFNLLNFEINHFGPLTPLIQDKDKIEEIAIIGLGQENPIYVYLANIGWAKSNFYFNDEEYVKELINKMSRSIGRQISLNTPLLNASLPNGSRLNAIISPISNKDPIITLRKFKFNPLTPIDLINYNTFSKEIATFLWLAMQTDSNILIAGNTGSGKTTTLNAIFSFVQKNERIIICEETPEVNIPHEHKIRLKIDEKKGINMNELIISTLRMRPDRLIVGEIRTKDEINSFIDTMLAGQGKGSYATFHALSTKDCLERLKKLGALEQDISAIDLIILQRRWNTIDIKNNVQKELRKIIEISEIIDNQIVPIYQYDFSNNDWINLNKSIRLKKKIEITYKKDFDKIFKTYKKRLDELLQKKYTLEEFFENANKLWVLDKYD